MTKATTAQALRAGDQGSSAQEADTHRAAEKPVVSGHTAKCWGRTSFSDEMEHCYCEPSDADTLATLLDNVVVSQSLSRELRERAHDEARSYLYDRRQRLAASASDKPVGTQRSEVNQAHPASGAEDYVTLRRSVLEHAIGWAREDRAFEPAAFLEEAISFADALTPQDGAVAGEGADPLIERLRKVAYATEFLDVRADILALIEREITRGASDRPRR